MLMLGRAAAAAAELAGLVREHPLREGLRGQLMLALYRCGRQAEALAAFADGRRVLVEELGVEPGPGLRRLHEQILAADSALGPPAAAVTLAGPEHGMGRARAAARGRGRVHRAGRRAGRAGQARRHDRPARRRRPAGCRACGDGDLRVGHRRRRQDRARGALGAAGPRRVPRRPALRQPARLRSGPAGARGDALAGFLRALGMPGQDIPRDVDERAAAYRTLLDGRRMLVVLDNASSGRTGPPAAARQPVQPGAGDQPGLPGRTGGPARRAAAGPGHPAAAGRRGAAAGADRRPRRDPARRDGDAGQAVRAAAAGAAGGRRARRRQPGHDRGAAGRRAGR